jgi:NodT family efflux transporter outer membrane factor (OMF) lipoprotein
MPVDWKGCGSSLSSTSGNELVVTDRADFLGEEKRAARSGRHRIPVGVPAQAGNPRPIHAWLTHGLLLRSRLTRPSPRMQSHAYTRCAARGLGEEDDDVKHRNPAAAVFIAGALLSGCMVGPEFRQPAPPEASRYTETPVPDETVSVPGLAGGAAQHLRPGSDLPAQWWSLFHSEGLDRLIRQAINDSPNLAAAQATLRQARENLAAQRGALLFPGVDLNAGAAREKITGAAFGQPDARGSIFSLYNASVKVSYMLDVFGGNRRELEALQSLVDYQDYQLEGAYLALTSNIVTSAIREASLRAQIQATREIIAAEQKQIALVQRQYELGAVARLSVLTLRAQLDQTRSTLPPLERNLAQTRHQLAVLSGRLPSEAALPEFDLDQLVLPQDLPLSLPSLLAKQRPDIRAAEALLHQASAQIGVATADLYPKIDLSGSLGLEATQLHNLFGGPAVWNLAASLAQPLFHGGELEAKRQAAIAAYDQAQAQYRQTVLVAFQNVADALRALEADARALSAEADAEASARETLALTQRQFQLGGASALALLVAEQQYQQARLALAGAQATRYADTAALFQSLGGGWWQRDGGAAAVSEP